MKHSIVSQTLNLLAGQDSHQSRLLRVVSSSAARAAPSSLGRLLLLLTHCHLLLLGGKHGGISLLLLLKESPSLVGLLLEVLEVGHELDRVDDALVVEQHARNLASRISVVLLDHAEDGVADLLAPVCSLKLLEAVGVDLRKHLLLLLLHCSHLLLLLLLSELHLSHLLGGHLHGLRIDRLALCLHVVVVTIATCRSHVVAARGAAAVVEVLSALVTTALTAALVATASLEATGTLLTVHNTVILHASW